MKEIVGSVRVLQGIGTRQPPRTPLRGGWVPLYRFQPLIYFTVNRSVSEGNVHVPRPKCDRTVFSLVTQPDNGPKVLSLAEERFLRLLGEHQKRTLGYVYTPVPHVQNV